MAAGSLLYESHRLETWFESDDYSDVGDPVFVEGRLR